MEGNYEGAIRKLNRIKENIYEELVESDERREIVSLILVSFGEPHRILRNSPLNLLSVGK